MTAGEAAPAPGTGAVPADAVVLAPGNITALAWDTDDIGKPMAWETQGKKVVLRASCDAGSGEGTLTGILDGKSSEIFSFSCNPARSGGVTYVHTGGDAIHFVVEQSGAGSEPGSTHAARLKLSGDTVKLIEAKLVEDSALGEGDCFTDKRCGEGAYCMLMDEYPGYCHGEEEGGEEE